VTTPPRAAIFGCAGPRLGPEEGAFFREADPLGFILFARNVETPTQVKALVADLRNAVGRADAPVLIDQEGGRVARLRPPHWRATKPAAAFAALYRHDAAKGLRAAWLQARLIAADLAALGIDVDCVPCADVPVPGAHQIIGDRAYGHEPIQVAALARASAEGLLAGGVLPVIKHLPGHGRAAVDTHASLPRVAAPLRALQGYDFAAFRPLADLPWGMTAHVIYTAIDGERPATQSNRVIDEVIRRWIGFDGLLLSDDLGMNALAGGFDQRAAACLAAGCDIALHCSGKMEEMRAVAAGTGPMSTASLTRLARGRTYFRAPQPIDIKAAEAELTALLGGEAGA